MKKFFTTIFAVMVACVSLFCLFGCKETNYDGKYVLVSASGREKGMDTTIMAKDEEGNYEFVNGGEFTPENFWVEINGDTFTVHGSITPVVGPADRVYFDVDENDVLEIKNFTLKKEEGESWYDILDSEGNETLWCVLRTGDRICFEYGLPDASGNLWYSKFYQRVVEEE